MYYIRKMCLDDYEEVVNMFYDFYKEVHSNRIIGYKYRYYETVIEWVNENKDIVVCVKGDTIVGFTMSYIISNGLTKPFYQCEIAYVKPKYRKTRASYLLYNNAVNYAKENNLLIVTNSRIENGVSDMVQKHFGCKATYTVNEKG